MMSINDIPLVSIVVITYNSSKYVIETLESIKNQSYNNIELIVSDDCSTDETVNICEQWIKLNKHRFVSIEIVTSDHNKGIPANCNKGIYASKGEWVKLVAGDDALNDTYISSCINYIYVNSHLDIQFLWTNIQRYRDNFNTINYLSTDKLSGLKINSPTITANEQFEILLRYNPVLAVSFIFNRKTLNELGGFNENYPLFEDWPMWLKITKSGYKIHYYDIIGVKYRIHVDSVQELNDKKKKLINLFYIAKSRMVLHEYADYYPFWERVNIIYLNKVNIFLDRINLNIKNKIIWFLYHCFTILPRTIVNNYSLKYR